LEIDGHDVSHQDPDWPAPRHTATFGYMIRFAVFEFPRNSAEISRRAELERTIRHFAEQMVRQESIDDLMADMVRQGFDADLVHEVESISTIAFGRTFFERHGVRYSPTIIRARRDGRIETGVPLMSIPAYTRARALAPRLAETMSDKDFQALCFYNAESNAILNALEDRGDKLDLTAIKMHPSVVPERGVSIETMNAAIEALSALVEDTRASEPPRAPPVPSPQPQKPWWQFW
jgi:hypothetical protein